MGLGVWALCFPLRCRQTIHTVNESSSEEGLIVPHAASTGLELPSVTWAEGPQVLQAPVRGMWLCAISPPLPCTPSWE